MSRERVLEPNWKGPVPEQTRDGKVTIGDIDEVLQSGAPANKQALLVEIRRVLTDDISASERKAVLQQLEKTLSAVSADPDDVAFVRSALRTAHSLRHPEGPVTPEIAECFTSLIDHPETQLVQAGIAILARARDAPNFGEQFGDHVDRLLSLCASSEPEIATPASWCIGAISRDCPEEIIDGLEALHGCLSGEGHVSLGPLWFAIWEVAALSAETFSEVVEQILDSKNEDTTNHLITPMSASFKRCSQENTETARRVLGNCESVLQDDGSSLSLILFIENTLQRKSIFEGGTADQAFSTLEAYLSALRNDKQTSACTPAWMWIRAGGDPESLVPYVDVLVDCIVDGTPASHALLSLLVCAEADPSVLESHVEELLETAMTSETAGHIAAGCVALVTEFYNSDATTLSVPFLSHGELSELITRCFDENRSDTDLKFTFGHAKFIRGCLQHIHNDSFEGKAAPIITQLVQNICQDPVETVPDELTIVVNSFFEYGSEETVVTVVPDIIEYVSRLDDPDTRRGYVYVICNHLYRHADLEFDYRVYQSLSDAYDFLPATHERSVPAHRRITPIRGHIDEDSLLPAPRVPIVDTLRKLCAEAQQAPCLPLGVACEAIGSEDPAERYQGRRLLSILLQSATPDSSEWLIDRTTERERRYSVRYLCEELEKADKRSFMITAVTLRLLQYADPRSVAPYADRVLRALALPVGDEPPVAESQLDEYRQLVPEIIRQLQADASEEVVVMVLTYFIRHSHGALRLVCVWMLSQMDIQSVDVGPVVLSELIKATRRPVDSERVRSEIRQREMFDLPVQTHQQPRSTFEKLVCSIIIDVLDEYPESFPEDIQRLTPLWNSHDPEVRASVAQIAKWVATHSPELARSWETELQKLAVDSIPVQSASIETLSVMGDSVELNLD